MKYKIQFELECPIFNEDGELIDPSCYDKDTIFHIIHPALYDQDPNWKLKNFKIKESK